LFLPTHRFEEASMTISPPPPPALSAVFSVSVKQVTDNLGAVVGAMAVWGALLLAANTAITFLAGDADVNYAAGETPSAYSTLVSSIALGLVASIVMSCTVTGFLRISRTGAARFADFFAPTAYIPILVIMVIVSAVNLAVTLIVGSTTMTQLLIALAITVVLSVLFTWSHLFAAAAGLNGVGAIAASISLALARPGTALLVILLDLALVVGGFLALLIGLLFTVPLAALITVTYFRHLTGEAVVTRV